MAVQTNSFKCCAKVLLFKISLKIDLNRKQGTEIASHNSLHTNYFFTRNLKKWAVTEKMALEGAGGISYKFSFMTIYDSDKIDR